MIMNKKIILTMVATAITTLFSCKKDFLDVNNVQANVSVDELYSNYGYAQQVVWDVYSYLPRGLDDLDLEATTDDAEATGVSDRSQQYNNGTWDQYADLDHGWGRNFNGIRQANQFLKNYDRIDIDYLRDRITSTDSTAYFNARDNVKFLKGEVYFLKAYFYFDLVRHYGGVPILKTPLDYADKDSWKQQARASVNDCIEYINALCDSAAGIIPQDLSSYSWYDLGRVTYGAIGALRSRVLLYAASPLYQQAGATQTWQQAAKAAHDVITLGKYSLDGSYDNLFGSGNTSSPEVIFYQRYGAIGWLEENNFPIVFQNSNGESVTPTGDFVDAFEVLVKDNTGQVTGSRPFNWNNPADAADPYASRDPRLGAEVVYNDMNFSGVTIGTYTGGNSGLPKLNATKTGYYLKKWINPSIDLVNGTTANHAWIYFRYAEILLNYAESMFHAYGPMSDPEGFGMTALEAINKVRGRSGMPALTAGALNQEAIEHERRVELGFEDQRRWDVRRWKTGARFNQPVHRVVITKTQAGFDYKAQPLENRRFSDKMYWFPIPQSDINKTGWSQNPGWN